ncbi:hypothetical protein CLNEO_29230 [Anaerotignum neopropionicum]|uniref:Lipoprotein n=1 Tax=Anaerotignum neopropionicum TaxID=36847 RepID=A0A136WB28_9FIRM|nr:hypothetical protein [Anaerotignum neopropionicum]KXL51717.1 hypothetical protein CLNEO_29230 [Anaerotignum neopropionicum]
MINRIKSAVSIVLIAVFFASGCAPNPTSNGATAPGESVAEKYVALASSKLETASSFAADFYAEVIMGGESEKTITSAKVEMIYEPLAAMIKTQDLYGANALNSETYLEKVDSGINMYMLYDGHWTEMTLQDKNARKSVGMYDAVKGMQMLLDYGGNWKQTSAKDGIVTISGEVPAEMVYEVSEGGNFLQLAGMNGVGESYYMGVEAVPFEVQLKEDGTPVLFSVDFAKTLETVMNCVLQELNADEENLISVEKYYIKQTISNFGEVKQIKIPVDARSAINYEKEISLLENSNVK